jgi:hypothetical protein
MERTIQSHIPYPMEKQWEIKENQERVGSLRFYEQYDLIVSAFAELRQEQHIIAKCNYLCCSSCGCYGIGEQAGKMSRKRYDKLGGSIFFHRQDYNGFMEDGSLMIRFDGENEVTQYKDENGDYQIPKEALGHEMLAKLVIAKLVSKGFKVRWNGNSNTCIEIIPFGIDDYGRKVGHPTYLEGGFVTEAEQVLAQ